VLCNSILADRPDDHLARHAAAHLARLAEGRSARRLAPRIFTTSVDANSGLRGSCDAMA
jgi:hypothetical protein